VDDPLHTLSTVGSGLTGLGGIALAIGGMLLLIIIHRRALATALDATPVTRCGELTAWADLPRRVIVRGRLRPDPARSLVTPLSGKECVWFRVQVTANPGSEGSRVLPVWESADRFTVADASGEVQVAARLIGRRLSDNPIDRDFASGLLEWDLLPDGRHKDTIERLKRAGMPLRTRRWGDRYRIMESWLPADREVTVLGRPRQGAAGTLLTATVGICGISYQTVDQLRANVNSAIAAGRSSLQFLLAGGAALLAVGLLLRLPHWLVG
jgi:hypothetical protein